MRRTSGYGIAALVALMVVGVLWGTALTQAGVERAVRQNFTAAGLLSRLQVEGEKMRRYEKEMFIYVANPDKRAGYVKEFDGAYAKMLTLLDEMLLPSSAVFTDAERKDLLAWKQAAAFYAAEFATLARKAEAAQIPAMPIEQRLTQTVEYNDAIRAGKDRFRELLNGTDKMRTAKEQHAQEIAADIDSTFLRLRAGVLVGGLVAVALVLWAGRSGRPVPRAGHSRPMPTTRL